MELDGAWLARGIDFLALPFDRQLNLAYYELMSRTEESKVPLVEMQLTAPLEGESLADTAEDNTVFFEEMMEQSRRGPARKR